MWACGTNFPALCPIPRLRLANDLICLHRAAAARVGLRKHPGAAFQNGLSVGGAQALVLRRRGARITDLIAAHVALHDVLAETILREGTAAAPPTRQREPSAVSAFQRRRAV